jgi:hypothetical protein
VALVRVVTIWYTGLGFPGIWLLREMGAVLALGRRVDGDGGTCRWDAGQMGGWWALWRCWLRGAGVA